MSYTSFSRALRQFCRSHAWAVVCAITTKTEALANKRPVRFAVRSSAVAMLAFVTGYGLLAGNHLHDPSSGTRGLPAQVSSWLGYAAEDIRISGLNRMDGAAVLNAVGVKPGGSLVGFDANKARKILLNLDWVKTASVRVIPPNRLEVEVSEREPFAIWQRDGFHYVIDKEGAAIASFNAQKLSHLMLVSGDGAQKTVSQLVNQLEGWPALHSKVKSAARVGDRRWTLYFEGGRRALLPEKRVETAIATLADLDGRVSLLSSGIREVDLRLPGSVVLLPFEQDKDAERRELASRSQ